MSAHDPTGELIRAMLARRADGPPPAWLLSSIVGRVPVTRQTGHGHGPGLRLPDRTGPRLALVAAAVLLLALVAGGILAAGGLLDRRGSPGPTFPAVVVGPSASAPAPTEPGASPSDAPSPTDGPPVAAGALAPDTLVAVTEQGFDLRVRSAPGTGKDSAELSPLLQPGARMLVLRGPVARDGYDWYEVILDDEPEFGWVAAGKDGEAWIGAVTPRCPATLDQRAAADLSRIEFFACFGDSPVVVRATSTGRDVDTGSEPAPCPYTGGSVPCEASPGWLSDGLGITLTDGRSVYAAARAATQRQLGKVPEVAYMTLTLAKDHPQSATCRVRDRRGRNLVPRDQAVAWCRLRFVITDVEWDRDLVLPQEDDVARVVAGDLPVHRSVGGDRYGTVVAEGTELLVVEGPESDEHGTPWYAVTPRTGIGWPWGWVPFLDGDRPTLARMTRDCPAPGDWAEIVRLDVAARVSCFASRPRMSFTALIEPLAAGPTGGPCRVYAELVDADRPCAATPAWLTQETGFLAADPDDEGAADDIWFDPDRVAIESVPTSPTLMRVTGRFWHPASSECEVLDPGTGESLVWGHAAWRYCAAQFVVTKLEPAP